MRFHHTALSLVSFVACSSPNGGSEDAENGSESSDTAIATDTTETASTKGESTEGTTTQDETTGTTENDDATTTHTTTHTTNGTTMEGSTEDTTSGCSPSAEGCACDAGGSCDKGLVCEDDRCVTNFVEIPGGPFWMGCEPADDPECNDIEAPLQQVEVSTFFIERTEVTQAAYARCVDAGACTPPSDPPACGLGAKPFDPEMRPNIPVACVTWDLASAYCTWLDARLPMEAEWEKAARGTDARKYPWGNEPLPSCETVVMVDDQEGVPGCGTEGPFVVGSRPAGASPYGVLDMLGNMREWVADWYGPYATNPGPDPVGPVRGDDRIARGGSWGHSTSMLRTSLRVPVNPITDTPSGGFRCAR